MLRPDGRASARPDGRASAGKSFVFLMMGTVVFFLCSISSADVPGVINYQGKLTTASGGCLNDTVEMTFSIYPDTAGWSAEWTETQAEVIVKEGVFSVLLGSVDTIPASVFGGDIKYLGVQVESDPEMRPLKPMVSVPYAYRAGSTDGGVGAGWVDDGTVVRLETQTDSVGFGTTTPTEKLDVVGNIHASGSIVSGNSIGIEDDDGFGPDRLVTDGSMIYLDNESPWGSDTFTGDIKVGIGDDDPDAFLEVSAGGQSVAPGRDLLMLSSDDGTDGDLVVVKDDGNVGIGTTNPQARLHVESSISTAEGKAVQVNFRSGFYSGTAQGIAAESDLLYNKGVRIGVGGMSSVNHWGSRVSVDGQLGHARGDDYGVWTCGVRGKSEPSTMSGRSDAFGGWFVAQSTGALNLQPVGKYRLGGVYGEVAGQVDVGNVSALVAGVIGVDASYGTANSYAGYFDGDAYVGGNLGIGTRSPGYKLEVTGTFYSNTVNTGQGNYELYAMNQNVRTTDNPTFNTVNTGQGSNYLFKMNQNVRTSDGPSFNRIHLNDYGTALGGFHVGGTSNPGTDNLLVDGYVGIGTASPPTKLAVTGLTGVGNIHSPLRYNPATGGIYYVASSARYKENIQPLQDDFSKILQAQPKSFICKSTGQKGIGYIAEEFDALDLNNLVTYNSDGQPDGVKYELVSLYLLEVLKSQVEAIKELKAENQELKQKIGVVEDR